MGIKVTPNVLFYSYGTMEGYRSFNMGSKCPCERAITIGQVQCCDCEQQRNIRMYSVYDSMSFYLGALKHQFEHCGPFSFHLSQFKGIIFNNFLIKESSILLRRSLVLLYSTILKFLCFFKISSCTKKKILS